MTSPRHSHNTPQPCADAQAKTPGQRAYERSVAASPVYFDGTPRRSWEQLSDPIRRNWEQNPRPLMRATPQSYRLGEQITVMFGEATHRARLTGATIAPRFSLLPRKDAYLGFSPSGVIGVEIGGTSHPAMSWRSLLAKIDADIVSGAVEPSGEDAVYFANCAVSAGIVFA